METIANSNRELLDSQIHKQSSLEDPFAFAIQLNKSHSANPHNSANSEIYKLDNEGIIKLKRLINDLAKMDLNMNVCYVIIEELNLEGDFEYEGIFNFIVDKYFNTVIPNEEDFNKKNTDQVKFKIFMKMFPQNVSHERLNARTLSSSDSLDKNHKVTILLPHVVLEIKENNLKKEENDEEEMIKPIDEGPKLNCMICMSDKSLDNFNPILKHDFCNECINIYIKECINSSKILNIVCPCNEKCGIKYDDSLLQQILIFDPILYNKYLKFKKIQQLNLDPNGRWCIRQGCENFVKGDENTKKITCNLCQQEMCFTCRNMWHPGRTCEEALDSDFKEYQKKILVKKCPKCQSRIEKNEGCNHMTCTRCHYEFCWLCSRKYSTKHYEWYNLCGCPSMQHRNFRTKCVGLMVFCEVLLKALGYLLLILLAIALYPLALVIGVFVLPVGLLSDKLWRLQKWTKILVKILIFFLGLILSPIVILLEIVPGTCIFILMVLNNDDD